MLSSESDIQLDGKGDQSSSGNKQSSFNKPPEPGVSGMQPSCAPTLLCGSESDDGSPIKGPRNLQARGLDMEDPTCAPTLLYGSESEDGSPLKRPRRRGAPSMALVLDESDFNVGDDNKAHNETNGSGVDVEEQVAGTKMDSTDDKNQKSSNIIYYPTALRRVQITPKTSTNITQYLYSRGPVRQVFSQRTSNKLD